MDRNGQEAVHYQCQQSMMCLSGVANQTDVTPSWNHQYVPDN